jgi:hypothetical protein
MTQGLNNFLSRIQTDYGFYLLFRQNPQAALGSYRLSAREEAALSEAGVDVGNDPRLALRGKLLNLVFIWRTHFSANELGDLEFDAAVAVGRAEIKQSLARLGYAGSLDDRLAVLETLMKHIG